MRFGKMSTDGTLWGLRVGLSAVIVILMMPAPATAQTQAPSSNVQAQTSQAGLTYVHCDQVGDTGSIDLTIDTAKSQVNNLPANITASKIDWSYQQDDPTNTAHSKFVYSLDRIRGTLFSQHTLWSTTGNNDAPPGTFFLNYTCTKTDAPVTKF